MRSRGQFVAELTIRRFLKQGCSLSRKRPGKPRSSKHRPAPAEAGRTIGLRRVASGTWELVHPRCALERQDDLEEVEAMIEAGENVLAIEELRWLLEDCRDFIAAHRLLGELALQDSDVKLARAHLGYAYQTGIAAIEAQLAGDGAKRPGDEMTIAALPGGLCYSQAANQDFFQAAKGLAWCLGQLGLADRGQAICRQMLALDSSDPLGFAALAEQLVHGDDGCSA